MGGECASIAFSPLNDIGVATNENPCDMDTPSRFYVDSVGFPPRSNGVEAANRSECLRRLKGQAVGLMRRSISQHTEKLWLPLNAPGGMNSLVLMSSRRRATAIRTLNLTKHVSVYAPPPW